MSAEAAPTVSVVIPTFQRSEGCRRAVQSALDQELQPLEVLVCDDGSTDRTHEVFEAWAAREPRLRYLRCERNSGSPSAPRNLGIEHAGGEWIAFLDDDDSWLPDKLAVQAEAIASGRYDLVASDAERLSGGPYFGLRNAREGGLPELLEDNPIIASSAVARRARLIAAGGFRDRVGIFSVKGIDDYRMWLKLADLGARFLIVPERVVVYDDSSSVRLSSPAAPRQLEVALVRWWLFSRRREAAVLRSALRASADALRWRVRTLLGRG